MQKLRLKDSFPFGKLKGLQIGFRLRSDLSYCQWWKNNVKNAPFDDEVIEALNQIQFEIWDREEKSYYARQHQKNLNKKLYSDKKSRIEVELDRFYDEDDGIIIGLNGF
jgi:hypothetical protein